MIYLLVCSAYAGLAAAWASDTLRCSICIPHWEAPIYGLGNGELLILEQTAVDVQRQGCHHQQNQHHDDQTMVWISCVAADTLRTGSSLLT
jgi:hypothetical protein